jgi:hypothetical protein
MGAAAAYMMEKMRISLNAAQLKVRIWAELGNTVYVEKLNNLGTWYVGLLRLF